MIWNDSKWFEMIWGAWKRTEIIWSELKSWNDSVLPVWLSVLPRRIWFHWDVNELLIHSLAIWIKSEWEKKANSSIRFRALRLLRMTHTPCYSHCSQTYNTATNCHAWIKILIKRKYENRFFHTVTLAYH